MSKSTRRALVFLISSLACTSLVSAETANPYLGRWALTLPDGRAGWMQAAVVAGKLETRLLWDLPACWPVSESKVEAGKLVLTRNHKDRLTYKELGTETITAALDGDNLKLTTVTKRPDGTQTGPASFTGKRIPPLPPKPDPSSARFGPPILLFNGKNLEGWKRVGGTVSGWSVLEGMMSNRVTQPERGARVPYANLRTVAEFEDFNLTLEVNIGKYGSSGVLLRGVYEVKVYDSFGDESFNNADWCRMGAITSRILPKVRAERPPGQWQTLDITLLDRHATVILNGQKVIDNEPLAGCSAGALWSDEFRPGPICLRGDGASVRYRNLVLRPILK